MTATLVRPVPFADSREHLTAELVWLELVLRRSALEAAARRAGHETFDEFAGLYVSEQEIARYADEAERTPALVTDERVRRLQRRIEDMRRQLDQRLTADTADGRESRLQRLQRRFGLSDVELRILICCLAPDWELRFQRYFAFLQNDVNRRRPTLQLLGDLWLEVGAAPFGARGTFSPDAPLLRERLLAFSGPADVPFPARQPLVAEAVADYLAGKDRPDALLAGFVSLRTPAVEWPEGQWYAQHRDIVARLLEPLQTRGRLPTAYVSAPVGCRKSLITDAVAAGAGVRVMRADCRAWLGHGSMTRESVRTLRRDARLHGCLLVLTGCEALVDDAAATACAALDEFLAENQAAGIILTGSAPVEQLSAALTAPVWTFEITRPDVAERAELWSSELSSRGCPVQPDLADRLAVAFRFTPRDMQRVLDSGRPAGHDAAADVAGTLLRRCRELSRHAIQRFATRIVPRRGWDDLVLPPDSRAQLEEICAAARSRRRVHEDWGFERKLALSAGLNVLFAGPSGVGKTMSAEILAGELGLDVYAIDLSAVVSKYIGETEKNLSRVFDEAEATNGVLFFDECDALFGKRTEIRDAHDRYANIEVNYLLQRIDRYDGIIILATNLRSNLDAAFTRRIRYAVEFPFPEVQQRERIWRRVFPEQTPLGTDIDFDFLARQFRMSGGSIKNIAVNAAFLAAGNGGRVGMKQVIHATRREIQKMGKTCTKAEFGRYYSWVREEGDT
jgi:hypothetical protein